MKLINGDRTEPQRLENGMFQVPLSDPMLANALVKLMLDPERHDEAASIIEHMEHVIADHDAGTKRLPGSEFEIARLREDVCKLRSMLERREFHTSEAAW